MIILGSNSVPFRAETKLAGVARARTSNTELFQKSAFNEELPRTFNPPPIPAGERSGLGHRLGTQGETSLLASTVRKAKMNKKRERVRAGKKLSGLADRDGSLLFLAAPVFSLAMRFPRRRYSLEDFGV